ncbi:neurosecretory protein VGF [Meriones unguiculatus]|uniref:neurosecretory protein VGF n=1 Tax=Meriones unguiculatus TaxID=10047 RepID=UPI00293E9932|nr:neurosecretory protein VGF [Meriones unguiculatus]
MAAEPPPDLHRSASRLHPGVRRFRPQRQGESPTTAVSKWGSRVSAGLWLPWPVSRLLLPGLSFSCAKAAQSAEVVGAGRGAGEGARDKKGRTPASPGRVHASRIHPSQPRPSSPQPGRRQQAPWLLPRPPSLFRPVLLPGSLTSVQRTARRAHRTAGWCGHAHGHGLHGSGTRPSAPLWGPPGPSPSQLSGTIGLRFLLPRGEGDPSRLLLGTRLGTPPPPPASPSKRPWRGCGETAGRERTRPRALPRPSEGTLCRVVAPGRPPLPQAAPAPPALGAAPRGSGAPSRRLRTPSHSLPFTPSSFLLVPAAFIHSPRPARPDASFIPSFIQVPEPAGARPSGSGPQRAGAGRAPRGSSNRRAARALRAPARFPMNEHDVSGAGPAHVTPRAPLIRRRRRGRCPACWSRSRAPRPPRSPQPGGPSPTPRLRGPRRPRPAPPPRSPAVMRTLAWPAPVLLGLLLLRGSAAAPPGAERAARAAEDAPEPRARGELFPGVDPRALAAALLRAPEPPSAPAAAAPRAEAVRSQTLSLPAPAADGGPGARSEELEALAALLQELRDFSPGAERQRETAEAEARTHTLTRVDLDSPGPGRVWRASWGEFQARVPEAAPLAEPEPRAAAPLPEPGAPLPEPGARLLRQGLAQVQAGRRRAEATRQAAAREERLADLASDLLLQYLLQGGGRPREPGAPGPREGGEERRGGGAAAAAEEEEDAEAAEAEAEAEEAERARQNALLFAEEEDGEAGAEDKRSQEEAPGRAAGDAGGDDDDEMDPQTIDSLIELSTRLHLPADDVVSIIEEVEEKRKRKKNAPPEPVPPPRAPAPPPAPPAPPAAAARDETPDWNEVLPPWDREEAAPAGPPRPFPNSIRPRTLPPAASPRRRHFHHALGPARPRPDPEAQARRAQEAADAEERRLQEQEEMENYIEHVLLRRP